jgi:hypothetical protein
MRYAVAEQQHLEMGCTEGATTDTKIFLGGAYVVNNYILQIKNYLEGILCIP